jgi:hypothetical protein
MARPLKPGGGGGLKPLQLSRNLVSFMSQYAFSLIVVVPSERLTIFAGVPRLEENFAIRSSLAAES